MAILANEALLNSVLLYNQFRKNHNIVYYKYIDIVALHKNFFHWCRLKSEENMALLTIFVVSAAASSAMLYTFFVVVQLSIDAVF